MLPAIFESNTLDRMTYFLNESNKIENIAGIDYRKKENQQIDKGHFGALVFSQSAAVSRKSLTVRQIKEWQGLVTKEQQLVGVEIDEEAVGHIRSSQLPRNVRVGSHVPPSFEKVPTLLQYLVEDINEGLKDPKTFKDEAAYCQLLGKSFQKFESIHPFVDGNGRVGRLLANYIATYCQKPIIVFNSEMIEKNRYYKAHDSSKEMVHFMANKTQEAIFGIDGKLFIKQKDLSGMTARYQSINGDSEDVEWHALWPLLNPDAEEDRKERKLSKKEKELLSSSE